MKILKNEVRRQKDQQEFLQGKVYVGRICAIRRGEPKRIATKFGERDFYPVSIAYVQGKEIGVDKGLAAWAFLAELEPSDSYIGRLERDGMEYYLAPADKVTSAQAQALEAALDKDTQSAESSDEVPF